MLLETTEAKPEAKEGKAVYDEKQEKRDLAPNLKSLLALIV